MRMKFRSKPLHRDVKRVREEQLKILMRYISREALQKHGVDTKLEDVLSEELKDPEKLASFAADMENFNFVATIMLATGMSREEIEELDEDTFWDLYEKSKEAIGGDVNHFFERYTGVSTSMKVK
jgi:hypothetical protein